MGRKPPTAEDALDRDDDRLREECGVFGIFGHDDAAVLTALGLHALQHRGQEGCGIVSYDGKRFHSERHLGLVGDTFSRRDVIERLPGNVAIGHVRYSTTGGTHPAQRAAAVRRDSRAAASPSRHNGNLTNGLTLRSQLVHDGAIFQSTSDTEVILHLIARSRRPRFVDRFVDALREIEGAYALVGLTNKKLIGARDPLGIRPLVLGELDGTPILASETCALDIIGARFVRDVENGEVVVISAGRASRSTSPSRRCRRGPASSNTSTSRGPDSIVDGRSVYDVRKQPGHASSPAKPGGGRRGGAGAGFRRARRDSAIAQAAASPTSSASSATTMSAAPSSSRRSRSASSACA